MDLDFFKMLGVVVGAISGMIALGKLVLAPIVKRYRVWRLAHPPFKRTVLKALDELRRGQSATDDYNAALLRERLESAYTIYCLHLGWCPSGEKRMLADLFELHEQRGWNHINQKYKDYILSLPESEAEAGRRGKGGFPPIA